MKSKNPFSVENDYAGWDSVHYETVCLIFVDGGVSTHEVVESMLYALCQSGVLEAGDSFSFAKNGNTIMIGKAQTYIDLCVDDTIN